MRLFVFSKSGKGSSIVTFVPYFYSFLFYRVVLQLLTYISNFSLRETTIPFPSISLSVPFQFAPLCEMLQDRVTQSEAERYFNSRLSARGYRIFNGIPNLTAISIHASLREATDAANMLQHMV